MSQQPIVNPLGLITQPNKLGQFPPGALVKALNAYIRNPGSLENSNSWANVSPTILASNRAYLTVFPNKWAVLVYFNTGLSRYTSIFINLQLQTTPFATTSFQDPLGFFQAFDNLGRVSFTVSRSRILTNSASMVWIYDYSDPQTAAQVQARRAGLLPPIITGTRIASVAGGGALADNTHCHCTVVSRRVYADGYEAVSAPGFCDHVTNATFGAASNIDYLIFINSNVEHNAGDVFEIYRTKSQPFTGTTGTNTGSVYFLDLAYTITAADIVAGFIHLTSSTPDSNLGEALYTNAGVKTADGAALPPPAAKVLCTFKGYTFYFNIIDRPRYSFRIPVFWGFMGDGGGTGESVYNRTFGIGERRVRGTTAIGNPTMTAIAAVDLVGVKIGQQSHQGTGTPFPAQSVVTAIGATTLTFNQNANANGAQVVGVCDVLEVDGQRVQCNDPQTANAGLIFAVAWIQCLDRVLPTGAVPTISPVNTVPSSEIVLTRPRLSDGSQSMAVRATNGANWVPALPRIENAETAKTFPAAPIPNGVAWSEENQPENCPSLNTGHVGSGEVYAAVSTRDAIWIFASDGLWRLSGTGGEAGAVGFDWRIDPVDSTLSLAGPQAACALRDHVFAYTNRGLVRVDSAGNITELSNGRLNDVMPGPPWNVDNIYDAAHAVYLIADETNDEILMREVNATSGVLWIYNTITDAFTQINPSGAPEHGTFSRFLQTPIIVDTTSTTIIAPSAASRATMNAKFQPFYADSPFVQRHWQQLDAVFERIDGATGSGVTVTAFANGRGSATQGRSLGSRSAIVPASAAGQGQTVDAFGWIAGWAIDRNCPAITNMMTIELSVQGSSPARLSGIVLHFVDLTPQRAKR